MFFHDLVSTYFGGHFMPESTSLQKVRRNSRLQSVTMTAVTGAIAGPGVVMGSSRLNAGSLSGGRLRF
ncbi:hypothetical protein FHT76_008357 [Rhizobium sp. BK176]|nr:hypothetical protein [Rhizobium sp. BK176]